MGIQIQPATADDHRALTALLEKMGLQYHSYQLQEDKPLKVVLTDISDYIQDAALRRQNLPIISAKRMIRAG